jgi:single-strand DNA-binding protein
MSGETSITLIGNVVSDPELRFTPAGAAVCKFRIASTPRKFDKQTNAWTDGEPLFLGASVWRQQAENVAESVTKGMRVVVVGRLTQRSYEDREGVRRTVYEIEADDVAVALARATAKVVKNPSSGGQQQGSAPNADPWATAQPANGQQQGGGWSTTPPAPATAGHPDQPPF